MLVFEAKGGSMFVRRFALSTVLLAIVAAACGGGGLSLQDYFTQMDGLRSSYEQKGADLQTQAQTALQGASTNEEALAAFKTFLEDSLTATDELVEKVDALEPPDEAASQHDDFVEAGKGIRDGLADVIARYDEFGSVDEISQFFATDLADEQQAGTDACVELQQVADDNDISVDLGCNAPA